MLASEVARFEPDLIVLAGFMRVLGPALLERFPGRIINVHPALLPSFPGHNGPQDALDGGEDRRDAPERERRRDVRDDLAVAGIRVAVREERGIGGLHGRL